MTPPGAASSGATGSPSGVSQIILRVTDLKRSVEFWSHVVGLGVEMEAPPFAFLDGGPIGLTLNQVDELPADQSLTEIVFEFEDVSGEYFDMSARGVPFEVDLRPVTSDGNRDLLAAHFRDPDGHIASVTGWVDRFG
jgi:catechol 2,3-dioxygenase-like lactoylglutathione lyase family enzyme